MSGANWFVRFLRSCMWNSTANIDGVYLPLLWMVKAGIGLQKWFKIEYQHLWRIFSFKIKGKNSMRGLNSDVPPWSDSTRLPFRLAIAQISWHDHFRNHLVSIKVISAVDFVTPWVYQTWTWGRQDKSFYSKQPDEEVDAGFGTSSPQILENPWNSWSLRE